MMYSRAVGQNKGHIKGKDKVKCIKIKFAFEIFLQILSIYILDYKISREH